MREFGRRALSLLLCLLISMQCLGGMTVSAAQTGQSPIMGSGDVLGVYLYPGAEETLPEGTAVQIDRISSEDTQAAVQTWLEEAGYTDLNFVDLWQISLSAADTPVTLTGEATLDVFYIDESNTVNLQDSENLHLLQISDDGIGLLDYIVSESWPSDSGTLVRAVTFNADCSAIYALAKTAGIRNPAQAGEHTQDAENCQITAAYGEDAGFPEGTVMNASRLIPGSESTGIYVQTARDTYPEGSLVHSDFYDISFEVEGVETEPAAGAAVDVTLSFPEGFVMGSEQVLYVSHFPDAGGCELLTPQILEQETTESGDILVKKISFSSGSFSVIGITIFDKGIVTVLNVQGEFFTGATSKEITKVWINWDGTDESEHHQNDTVTVVLEGVETLADGTHNYYEVDRVVLTAQNNWTDEFTGLDATKTYRMVESSVTSGDVEMKDDYRTELYSGVTYVESWELTELFSGGSFLIKEAGTSYKLRASTSGRDMADGTKYTHTRKISNAITSNNYSILDSIYPSAIFNIRYSTSKPGYWYIQNRGNNYYLSLVLADDGEYRWVNTSTKVEGSYLTVENGKISATTGGVTRWMAMPADNTNGSLSAATPEESPTFEFYTHTVTTLQSDATLTNRRNYTPEDHSFSVSADVAKSVDYLGDGGANPDTDADENTQESILQDLYRLYLDFIPRTDATGLDLVLAMDVSSSMRTADVVTDEGKISRDQALLNALDTFIPDFLNDSNGRNRISIVVFNGTSMILQDWTQDENIALAQIHHENLMKGSGTNYEAALMRVHEAFAARGASTNKKALVFLSDGTPGQYVIGNDEEEPGNVTISLGDGITIGTSGPTGLLPDDMYNGTEDIEQQTLDAISSFRFHNPDVVIGTIAFMTTITKYQQAMATDESYIIKITEGGIQALLDAMKIITDFAPTGIAMTDILSDNVEIYGDDPDYRATMTDPDGNVTVLYENGVLTTAGALALDNTAPVVYNEDNRSVTMTFRSNYLPEDDCKYTMSFNIQPSQKAYNKFADAGGVYTDPGAANTDYPGNDTSSGKSGYYSNGTDTSVVWVFQNVGKRQYYPMPVIQVRDGTLTIHKTDLTTGTEKLEGTTFALYRQADNTWEESVPLEGLEGSFVKVSEGTTDENGQVTFTHLRLGVLDGGYHYYLVETEASGGYCRVMDPMGLTLYQNRAVPDGDAGAFISSVSGSPAVLVKNESSVILKLTKVAAEDTDEPLPGAEFAVYRLICTDETHDHNGILDVTDVDGQCWRLYGEQVSGEDGKMIFNLPVESSYRLVETKAPGGYVLPKGQWTVTVAADKTVAIAAVTGENGSLPPAFLTDPSGGYRVPNMKPREIPTTGGLGAGDFRRTGMLLMAAGAVVCMLANKRRKYACENK